MSIVRNGNAWLARVWVKEESKYRNKSFAFSTYGGNRGAKHAARTWKEGELQRLARERIEALELGRPRVATVTAAGWALTYKARRREDSKLSTYDSIVAGLKPFEKTFGNRPLRSITRGEAVEWAQKQKRYVLLPTIAMMNAAVDAEMIGSNPFHGLGKSTKGRSRELPPTLDEMASLREACAVHGDYAQRFRSLLDFAAHTGMRPSELYALEWRDIDFENDEVRVERRLYRGHYDTPKTGRRRVALTPPARDALLPLPRSRPSVFLTKNGALYSQSTLSTYWRRVLDKAGLDFDFYLATRHYCAHYLWVHLGVDIEDVREQIGHVDEKLIREVYGHRHAGALDRIKAAYGPKVVELKAVSRPS